MPVLVFGLGKLQRGRKEEVTFAVPRRTGDGHSERPGKPPAFLNSQVSETRSGVYVAFLHRCSLPNQNLHVFYNTVHTTVLCGRESPQGISFLRERKKPTRKRFCCFITNCRAIRLLGYEHTQGWRGIWSAWSDRTFLGQS